ncbi:hypothetical protein QFZ49_005138 [Streptomyces turgidiscabies]|uniref:Uncharacterized protein n=1 Tax=Streptomyces turgidiscabies TaxID=85558 RepID=A0ABU0RT42_9ACTN|nr:hypothetical protein [Streptomyces turgidiscabies]MDQ0935167.1 hypothetical protein [Streptomyces turgidiscabies]
MTTFVLRFVGTEALVYLPRKTSRRGEHGEQEQAEPARRAV